MTNIDVRMEAERLYQLYNDDPRTGSIKGIIYGGFGTGKTSMLRTCRLPLHVDSFDPGGTKVLRGEAILNGVLYPDEMKRGNIICDTRYEVENPFNPSVVELWDKEFERRLSMGYFDRLGTYVIDSMTTWAQDVMYLILRKAGRTGGVPQQNDWLPQMTIIENAMRKFLKLPCDCILIGHDNADKDESTGKMFVSLLITGKLVKRVPILFDEIWMAQTKETSKGMEYQLLTKSTGLFTARSRLCNKGQIGMYEPADIKAILKKAGLPTDDKPSLFQEV
jgi:hypothetical protein